MVNADVNSSKKLVYLNGLVKLCMKEHEVSDFGVSYRDLFCWYVQNSILIISKCCFVQMNLENPNIFIILVIVFKIK